MEIHGREKTMTNKIVGCLYFGGAVVAAIVYFFAPLDPTWMLGFFILSKLCFIEETLKEKSCDCSLPK